MWKGDQLALAVNQADPASRSRLGRWAWAIVALVLLQLLEQGWRDLLPALSQSRSQTLVVLVGAALLAPLVSGFSRAFRMHWFALLTAGALLTVPLWAALLLGVLTYRLGRRRGGLWICLPLMFAAGLVAHLIRRYGFNGDTLLAVLQTHAWEAVDFILSNLGYRFVFGFLTQSLLLVLFARDSLVRTEAWRRMGGALLTLGTISAALASAVGTVREARQHVVGMPRLTAPAATNVISPRDIDVILVLGEATSKWHMQLYGYSYPTNPKLVRRGSDLVLMQDAVSVHSHTVPSLASLMLRRSPATPTESHSLLGRLRASGVDTVWYSTQLGLGPWDSPVRQVAAGARQQFYFEGRSLTLPRGLDYELHWGRGNTADEDMIDDLVSGMSKLTAGPSFRVAHLTAGHDDYCRNLPHRARAVFAAQPRGAQYFGNAKNREREVNCYDGAMWLVDDLIDRVIQRASERSRPTLVIFTPDHGEDPDGGTAHSSALHNSRHVEIPVIFYMNEAAKRQTGGAWSRLQAHASQPFALPWLHETLLDLFGLLPDEPGDASRSLLSDRFRPIPRTLFADSLPLSYDALVGDRQGYLQQAKLAVRGALADEHAPRPRHLLGHRNNSELALMEAMQVFEGAEMDVVFDEKTHRFHIYHEPAAPTGFGLERALEISSARPGFLFWLDWKNASAVNVRAALAELERLDARFHFKSRTWVETGPDFVDESGAVLAGAGYRHSYYLAPSSEAEQACRSDRRGSACIGFARQAAHQARQAGAGFVSFDLVQQAYGRAVIDESPGLKALTWDMTTEASQAGMAERLEASAFAEVGLIRLSTRYWR